MVPEKKVSENNGTLYKNPRKNGPQKKDPRTKDPRKIVLRQRNVRKFKQLSRKITIYLVPSFVHGFIIHRQKETEFQVVKIKIRGFLLFFFRSFPLFLADSSEKALKA